MTLGLGPVSSFPVSDAGVQTLRDGGGRASSVAFGVGTLTRRSGGSKYLRMERLQVSVPLGVPPGMRWIPAPIRVLRDIGGIPSGQAYGQGTIRSGSPRAAVSAVQLVEVETLPMLTLDTHPVVILTATPIVELEVCEIQRR